MLLIGRDYENPFGKVAPKSGRVKNMSELLDSAVFPGMQGGPLMHVIAAKAVAFGEALSPSFTDYCSKIVANARVMAETFVDLGYDVVSGGTDNHLMLIDLRNKEITGKQAEETLGLAEGASSNIFIVRDGRVLTPGLEAGLLAGITRSKVIEECRAAGIDVSETALRPADVRGADEAFLTSTLREVLPVVRVDDTVLGTGRPGVLTLKVREAYRAHVRKRIQSALRA